jgi:copper resistance protein B
MNISHRVARLFSHLFALLLVTVAALSVEPARAQMMGEPMIHGMFLAEQFEYGVNGGSNPVTWDVTSWVGGDWNRIWFKSEGEMPTAELGVEGEAQLLYSRLIAPFWEFQVGMRGDLVAESGSTQGRGLLVVGLEGLAPYWFEIEPAIFVSHGGDVSARLRAAYDLFVTQRLIAQSSFEANVAVQSVPEFGVGSGFADIELGLRLRFEVVRECAPYVGVSWKQTFAETARLRRDARLGSRDLRGIAGIRFWF